jgi:hypothetical protein
MKRLTIINVPGDPEALLAAKREHMDPVMRVKGPHYGGILHVTARSEEGLVIVNLWDSPEGSDAAFADPDVAAATAGLQASGAVTGPPQRTHYDVVDYMTGAS